MPASKNVIDSEAREQAVLTDDHAFVWASAGTGKTHTLTLRALFLLFKFGSPGLFSPDRAKRLNSARSAIQSIVLTTFTRKAAAEMRIRLFQYMDLVTASTTLDLLKEQKGVEKDPLFRLVIDSVLERFAGGDFGRLRQAAQALGERASELQVSTIHSFAASILKRHPVEAGIPPDARFADEDSDDLTGVADLLVERWWETEAQENPSNLELLPRVLQVATLSEVNHWLVQTYYRPWIAKHAEGFGSIDEVTLKRTLVAARKLSELLPLRPRPGKRMLQVIDKFPALIEAAESGNEWVKFLTFLMDEKGYLFLDQKDNKFVDQITQLEPQYREVFESFTHTYSVLLAAALQFQLQDAWSAWREVLSSFREWVQGAALRELGLLTFDDVIRLSREMLSRDEAVRLREFQRIKALLVDEFQDTDRQQLELLALVLRRVDQIDHEPLGFFVGDVKQSIYRFRGADVPEVENFAETYEGCVNCTRRKRDFRLVTSFRSAEPVVSFVNRFFSEPIQLAAPEEQLVSFRGLGGKTAQWVVVDDVGEKRMLASEAKTLLAEAAADVINKFVEEQGSRVPSFGKVLILTRTNDELNSLLPVLTRSGIPVISGGAKTFLKNQEVLDAVNLLICLHNPLDSVAAAAVLRSPMTGLKDDDLNRLLKDWDLGGLLVGEEPFPDYIGAEIIGRLERLRALIADRRTAEFSEWIRKVESLIPKAVYVSDDDPAGYAAARVTSVMRDFREECIRGRTPPLVWLLRKREMVSTAGRYDEDLGEDVSITDETINAVRVMTVHKAKGLEASLVIAYGWGGILQKTQGRGRSGSEIVEARIGDRHVQALALSWGGLKITSPEFVTALNADEKEYAKEAERLAYVAATRAEDRLVLLQRRSELSKLEHLESFLLEEQDSGQGLNIQVLAWESGEPVEGCSESALAVPRAGYDAFWAEKYRRFNEEPIKLLTSPSQVERTGSGGIDLPEFERDEEDGIGGLEVGLLVHRYLEKFLLSEFPVPTALEQVVSLLPEGPPSQEVQFKARQVLEDFFDGTTGDPEDGPYREMIRRGKVLGREVPVYMTIDGQSWHGIVDLILEYSGVIYAVDYKTGKPHKELPPSYVKQREIYTAALKQLFPERKIDFMFWWLESVPLSTEPMNGSL